VRCARVRSQSAQLTFIQFDNGTVSCFGFHELRLSTIVYLANAHHKKYFVEWKKNDTVTVTFRDVRVYETEKDVPTFSTVTRAAFIADVETKLGWTHVKSVDTVNVSEIYVTPPRGHDQDMLDALRHLEPVLDIVFQNDAWIIMWIEKTDRSRSLRTLKRQRPELFAPTLRGRSGKSRFRPQEKGRFDYLYNLVRFR